MWEKNRGPRSPSQSWKEQRASPLPPTPGGSKEMLLVPGESCLWAVFSSLKDHADAHCLPGAPVPRSPISGSVCEQKKLGVPRVGGGKMEYSVPGTGEVILGPQLFPVISALVALLSQHTSCRSS